MRISRAESGVICSNHARLSKSPASVLSTLSRKRGKSDRPRNVPGVVFAPSSTELANSGSPPAVSATIVNSSAKTVVPVAGSVTPPATCTPFALSVG